MVIKLNQQDLPVYEGDDLGYRYGPSATKFRLWAPDAEAVSVHLYDSPEGGEPEPHLMAPDIGGTWVTRVPGDLRGRYYLFLLTRKGETREVMDPYAVAAGVDGHRAMVVNLRETDPPNWESHPRPLLTQPTDAVLYEIHVRDLTMHPESGVRQKGKFLGFAERGTRGPEGVKTGLDHLVELGVTHVHLLPIADFATVDERNPEEYNWGYDPQNYNLPEGSYATDPNGTARIWEFKQLVKSLHEAGLLVVMDVVYNHTYLGMSPFEAIAPEYFFRYDADGTLSNGSGTGNETASERPMVRKYIVDSVSFWAREYRVDGFRFDLMALHDMETMRAVREALDRIDPSIIIYGEPWTGGPSPLDPARRLTRGNQRGMGIAIFNDHFRSAIKGDNDGWSRGFATGDGADHLAIMRGVTGSIQFGPDLVDFALHPAESVNYVSSHDNLTLWDKLLRSNPEATEEVRVRMDLLCQAIVLTSQGIPFLHGGEELLRTKGGHHNSYKAGDEVNRLDWNQKADYPGVFEYYRSLIALRKAHPAFRLPTADLVRKHLTFLDSVPKPAVGFLLGDHAGGDLWRKILVVYNPSRHPMTLPLPPGTWEVAARGLRIGENLGFCTERAAVPPLSMLILFQA